MNLRFEFGMSHLTIATISHDDRRGEPRRAVVFIGVAALHAALVWLLWSAAPVLRVENSTTNLQVVNILGPADGGGGATASPAAAGRGGAPQPGKARPAGPRDVAPGAADVLTASASPTAPAGSTAPPSPTAQAGQSAPGIQAPVDWYAELERTGRAAANSAPAARSFGFPVQPPAPPKHADFGWSHARTHRVESVPGGGLLINLSDRCILVLNPFPFPICGIGNIAAKGDLFRNLQDSGQADAHPDLP